MQELINELAHVKSVNQRPVIVDNERVEQLEDCHNIGRVHNDLLIKHGLCHVLQSFDELGNLLFGQCFQECCDDLWLLFAEMLGEFGDLLRRLCVALYCLADRLADKR